MKKFSVLMLLVLVVFAGCKKKVEEVEKKVLTFDIKNEKAFLVSAQAANAVYTSQGLFNLEYPIEGVSSSTEADLQKNNTTTALVKNVEVKELILTLPDNSAESFSFLERMDVYIAMPDKSEPLLVAHNRNIPNTNVTKLVFTPVAGATVDKYIRAGNYTMLLKDVKMRRQVTADLNLTVRMTYSVTASPLN